MTTATKPAPNKAQHWFWQGKFFPAFWTIASVVSLVVNLILILVLIFLGRQLFSLKGLIQNGLIGGLYDNFVLMEQAHITTDIQVNATIPVVFDLPLNQNTEVTLTEPVSIPNTAVYLNGVPVYTTVVLPEGTPLNISLNLIVPVSQTLPVSLPVHVDIPLEQTQLKQPFVGLQNVVSPYRDMLGSLPNSWQETPVCGPLSLWFCNWLFDLKD